MKILIACEKSGVVRDAFAARGHDAYSCDIVPSDAPGQHLQMDAIEAIRHRAWDLIIAHPPCTHIAVSGALHFKRKRESGEQQQAMEFFMAMVNAPCWRVCVENPVCIMSTLYRKPDQIIQPYQFGHAESKKTCLWLKNLPLLVPTCILRKPDCGYWKNQTPSGQNRLGPSPTRAADRAKTYIGIAEAMSFQWGTLLQSTPHTKSNMTNKNEPTQ